MIPLLWCAGAAAGETPSPSAPSPLVVEIKAGVWFPRADGSVSLGSNQEIQIETGLDLNDSEATFNGDVTIRRLDTWNLRFTGFDFSTDHSGTFTGNAVFGSLALNDGDPFEASLDLSSYAVELGYDVWRPYPKSPSDASVDMRIGPFVGVRYVDVEQVVERPGVGRQRADGEWLILGGGMELRLRYAPPGGLILGKALILEAGIGAGGALGNNGGFAWQIAAGLTLEVWPGVGVMFGYRLLELNVDNDDQDYTFDGGLQGLFIAATLRF